MHFVYSDKHKLHATDEVWVEGQFLDTREVPARVEAILGAVLDADLGPVTEPIDHGLDPILAVHDRDYVKFLQTANAESAAFFQEAGPVVAWTFASRHAIRKPKGFLGLKGYYGFGWGNPILQGTWEAAYWSAQTALTAADLVRERGGAAYALCRPPGHHSAADLYGGYCYLNNAAIAARHLQHRALGMPKVAASGTADQPTWRHGPNSRPETKIAILDIDYHHGNGTQILFYSDPTVLFCSLHVHPDEDYPYYWGAADELGEGLGEGANRNWPLPRGTADGRYLATLDEALAAIDGFAPEYLVVSAGFDTMAGDPEGGFRLTTAGLRAIGGNIAALGLPTVLVQEGGYLLEELGADAVALLSPFAVRDTGSQRRML